MFRHTCNAAQGSTEGIAAAPAFGSLTASDPTAGDAGMSRFWSAAI